MISFVLSFYFEQCLVRLWKSLGSFRMFQVEEAEIQKYTNFVSKSVGSWNQNQPGNQS